jgi:hypothetical protein
VIAPETFIARRERVDKVQNTLCYSAWGSTMVDEVEDEDDDWKCRRDFTGTMYLPKTPSSTPHA